MIVPSWRFACEGTGDWSCESSSLEVLSVTYDGCVALSEPRPALSGGIQIDAAATNDGPIRVEARLRLNPGDATTVVTATTIGDHDTAIEARCMVIDTAELSRRGPDDAVPFELFRDCEATRGVTETVVLIPGLRTFRGHLRFPYCMTGCGKPAFSIRPPSDFSMEPAPIRWGRTDTSGGDHFAILPALANGGTAVLTAQLLPAGTATMSIKLPSLHEAMPSL